jgi:hypothetical protein
MCPKLLPHIPTLGGESVFFPNILILLDHLRCEGRFYLQRGLRLRRFGHLSGDLHDVREWPEGGALPKGLVSAAA